MVCWNIVRLSIFHAARYMKTVAFALKKEDKMTVDDDGREEVKYIEALKIELRSS